MSRVPIAPPVAAPARVRVAAPARLHLGMLDVAAGAARRYGGFGVGVAGPRVVVDAAPAPAGTIEVSGPERERAAAAAARALAALGLPGGAALTVREAIPAHAGLGSGTKLALAVARALAALHGADPSPAQLARAVGRGRRSAVGLWTFAGPGLVLEGGPRDELAPGPLLGRWPLPPDWRCVLALPGATGLSGQREEAFFAGARDGGGDRPARIAQLVVTQLLPALVEQEPEAFGAALTEIQLLVGAHFEAAQGGRFHPRAAPLVGRLRGLGAAGVGQSSWGPATYGVVGDPERAAWIAARLRAEVPGDTRVEALDFDRSGATVEAPCGCS